MRSTLSTPRLTIREPILSDAEGIFLQYATDLDVVKYLTWEPHASIDDTRRWIQFCLDGNEKKDGRYYRVLADPSSNTPMGMIEARISDFRADLGYVLAKPHWNQGYMTEAVRAVIDELWTDDGIYRIAAVHSLGNEASGKVLQKCGMTFEGILRRYIILPNLSTEPQDVKMYALVR